MALPMRGATRITPTREREFVHLARWFREVRRLIVLALSRLSMSTEVSSRIMSWFGRLLFDHFHTESFIQFPAVKTVFERAVAKAGSGPAWCVRFIREPGKQ